MMRRTAQWHLHFGVDTESICIVVWLAKLEDNVIEVLESHKKFTYVVDFGYNFVYPGFLTRFCQQRFLFIVFRRF